MNEDFSGNMWSVALESATAKQPWEEGGVGERDNLLIRQMMEVGREIDGKANGAWFADKSTQA
jgi:hypothetical protein